MSQGLLVLFHVEGLQIEVRLWTWTWIPNIKRDWFWSLGNPKANGTNQRTNQNSNLHHFRHMCSNSKFFYLTHQNLQDWGWSEGVCGWTLTNDVLKTYSMWIPNVLLGRCPHATNPKFLCVACFPLFLIFGPLCPMFSIMKIEMCPRLLWEMGSSVTLKAWRKLHVDWNLHYQILNSEIPCIGVAQFIRRHTCRSVNFITCICSN